MSDNLLSLMIISPQHFCDRLKPCLVSISEKQYKKGIRIKLAENVSDVIKSAAPNTGIDFVAVVVDTSVPQAVEKCKRDISLIVPLFVASKICLVNGACKDGSTEIALNLIKFADRFNIPYFNGQIMDNLSCRVTAERILRLAAFASGYSTGVFGIIPTPKDLGLLS